MEEMFDPVVFSTSSLATIGEIAFHQPIIANTLTLIGHRVEELTRIEIGKIGLIRGYCSTVKCFLQYHGAHADPLPTRPVQEKVMLVAGNTLLRKQPLFVIEYQPEALTYPLQPRIAAIPAEEIDSTQLEYLQRPVTNQTELAKLLFWPKHTWIAVITSKGERLCFSIFMTAFHGGRYFGNPEMTFADYPELANWIEASEEMVRFYKALDDVHNS